MRIADDVLSPFPSLSTIFRFPALQALAAGFSAPAAGGSIFGATAADDSIFGGNPAAGGSSIGAPAAGGSIFGASAISFNFGATAADGSIFGAAPAAGGFSFGAAPAAGGFSTGAPATQTNTATDVARSVRGPSGGGGAKVAQISSFFHRTTKNASSSPAFNPLSPSPPLPLPSPSPSFRVQNMMSHSSFHSPPSRSLLSGSGGGGRRETQACGRSAASERGARGGGHTLARHTHARHGRPVAGRGGGVDGRGTQSTLPYPALPPALLALASLERTL